MVFYESACTDPYYNLAAEEYFLTRADPDQDYFLLWQNDRAVIVGKYQNTLEEVDQRRAEEQGIRVARRLSGGGAVYHDLGNLNYTFIVSERQGEEASFQTFARPLISALEELGLHAFQSGRNDIMIGEKKISGASRYLRSGRLLHHGCILLDCDLSVLSQVLLPKSDKIRSKGISSVRSRVTNINDVLAHPISMEELKQLLVRQVFPSPPQSITLPDSAQKEIQDLRDSKYAAWEWNYGLSPACDIRRDQYFPFGSMTLFLTVKSGVIQTAKICGDFFCRQEPEALEALLCGHRLERDGFASLTQTDLSQYIPGLTWEQLLDLMCG